MFQWLENLIAKQAGKTIAKDLNIQEGTQVDTSKPWFKQKTFYVALVTAVLGAVQPVSSALGHPIVIPQWVYEVLAGAGLYTLRQAVNPPPPAP